MSVRSTMAVLAVLSGLWLPLGAQAEDATPAAPDKSEDLPPALGLYAGALMVQQLAPKCDLGLTAGQQATLAKNLATVAARFSPSELQSAKDASEADACPKAGDEMDAIRHITRVFIDRTPENIDLLLDFADVPAEQFDKKLADEVNRLTILLSLVMMEQSAAELCKLPVTPEQHTKLQNAKIRLTNRVTASASDVAALEKQGRDSLQQNPEACEKMRPKFASNVDELEALLKPVK